MPCYAGGENNFKIGKNVGETNKNNNIVQRLANYETEPVYTLIFPGTGGTAYADSKDFTDEKDMTWNITGNLQTGSACVYIGGRSLDNVNRVIYSKTSINANVGKIVINNPEESSSSLITVNKVEVGVYENAENAAVATQENSLDFVEGTFTNGGSTTINFDQSKIGDKTELYFAIIYNVTNTSSSTNKRLIVGNIDFYQFEKEPSKIAKNDIKAETTKAQLKYSFNVTKGEAVSSFVKVTSAPSDWSGQYLIGYEPSGTTNQVNVLKANLTSDSIGNNNSISCEMNQNVIAYSSDLYDYVVNIDKITEDSYSLQSNNQKFYFDGTTAKKLNTSDSPISHTLELSDTDKKIKIKCGDNYLQYNASSSLFRYYAGTQQNVYLYKYTELLNNSYNFFNMKMNLGAVIEVSKVKALVDAGLTISSYGVAVAQKSKLGESSISDAIINESTYVSVVSKTFTSLDDMKKTDASGTNTEGDYVIFNANLPVGDDYFTTEITAVAYFLLDDGTENSEYVFLQERTLSVASLAQAYIDNTDVYDTFDDNIKGSLKALAAMAASVA